MNKYEEAIESLKRITEVPSVFINDVVKGLVVTFYSLVHEIYPRYLELEKRATPMKPSEEMTGGLMCDKCFNQIVTKDMNFCSNCGQAIDWSENE